MPFNSLLIVDDGSLVTEGLTRVPPVDVRVVIASFVRAALQARQLCHTLVVPARGFASDDVAHRD